MEVEGTPGARGHPQAPSPRTALSILAPHHQSSSRVCEHLCFILMYITHLLARCVLRCCFFALCHFDLTEGLAGTLLWDSGEPVSFVKEATQSPGIRVGQDHPAMQLSASVSPGYASIQGSRRWSRSSWPFPLLSFLPPAQLRQPWPECFKITIILALSLILKKVLSF